MKKTNFNYSQICRVLLKDLPERNKDVLSRRFGLGARGRETLESIGQDYSITRERVRQIEKDGFLKLKEKRGQYQPVFQSFQQYLKTAGGLKKEDKLLEELAGKKQQNQVYFLLTLGEGFERLGETEDLHALWLLNQGYLSTARKTIGAISAQLEKASLPIKIRDLRISDSLKPATLASYLEVSKIIQQNAEGLYGLREWPEINPRGVKDKAYLVFKKEQKPLHFREVAVLIDKALPQTVHNELIKDKRFVLVGRGLYALQEWGYEQGYVKDVIYNVLKDAGKPLAKQAILAKVLKQRLVKENTILLNLSDKRYFSRTPQGDYTIREA